MANYTLNAAIKGVIEGITEFLPISSTGHLALFDKLLPLTDSLDPVEQNRLNHLFDIIIQFPAILAIVVLYRVRVFGSLAGIAKDQRSRSFWFGLCVAFVPVGIAGLGLHHYTEKWQEDPRIIAAALIVGGIGLILTERLATNLKAAQSEDVPLSAAINIGLFQCLSLWPGFSRSGSCMMGGRIMGLSREVAAEYSFFLAIPTMFAAFVYKLAKEYKNIKWETDGPILAVGSLVSFVVALAAVAILIKFLQKHSLAWFGGYRIVLGAAVLLWGTH